jgi:hypothetical protein
MSDNPDITFIRCTSNGNKDNVRKMKRSDVNTKRLGVLFNVKLNTLTNRN